MAESEVQQARVRPAEDTDLERINVLLRAEGFRSRSLASWRWLFHDNPCTSPGSPLGWVIEADAQGPVYGYLGNIPVRYALGERTIPAATCTAYCVQPPGRSQSVNLLQAWFRQRGPRLFLSTSANASSGPIYRMFKTHPPEGDSFREALIWVAADHTILQAGAARLGLPPGLARAAARLAAPPVRLGRRLVGLATPPRQPSTPYTIAAAPRAAVDGAFDDLWEAVRRSGGLRTWRDAATLRWIMADPDLQAPLVLLAARQQGTLVGYVLASPHHTGPEHMPILRLLDLVIRPGHAGDGLVTALLGAALEAGARSGAGILYCSPSGSELRSRLQATRPYVFRRDHDAHFIRTHRSDDLPSPTALGIWQAAPLDGDIPFVLSESPLS